MDIKGSRNELNGKVTQDLSSSVNINPPDKERSEEVSCTCNHNANGLGITIPPREKLLLPHHTHALTPDGDMSHSPLAMTSKDDDIGSKTRKKKRASSFTSLNNASWMKQNAHENNHFGGDFVRSTNCIGVTMSEIPMPPTQLPPSFRIHGLTDLEPFLHPENFVYPVIESPRKRSVDFLLDIPKIVYELTHVTQTMTWDCGVSCVAMCLTDEQRRDFFKRMDWFCYNEECGFGTSTWTIDLCYVLAYYRVKHSYFTVTLGVNPDLKRENFYKGIIDRDMERVTNRFKNAEKNGLGIYKRSLSIEEIFYFLASKGPLITLVNANLLVCQKCTWSIVQACRPCCCKQYQGHFIVVVGYNVERKIIYYRNPALSSRLCEMKVSDFEEARLSFGTDEDVIAIELPSHISSAKTFDIK